ncbi:MAG: XisI protein [Cyanobacteria bacterium P01_E01_bin.42]
MEKVEKYREYILKLLNERAEFGSSYEEIEIQKIFDIERNHYQLVHTGWRNQRRFYGCFLHLDIKDGKIWIQHDGTEIAIADELLNLGVPKEDIVLAFHSPYMRQFTDFSVG